MTLAAAERVLDVAPEDRLVLECARTELDPAGGERVAELLRGSLDWRYLLEASIRHGVAPLVHDGLERAGAARLAPGWARDDLAELRRGSAARNRRLFGDLTGIVAAMRAEGVEPVALKDIQLAAEAYADPAQRPLGDVDLLVRRADWDGAARALVRLSFRPRPDADVPYTRRYAVAQHFRRAADETWVDLQWSVLEREWDRYAEGTFSYDGLELWQRAAPMRAGGLDVRVPRLEDMLFHLCLHLEGHRYCELVLFCDIAELIRRFGDRVDWDEVLAITRRHRAEAAVYYVLLLTRRLLGVGPPEDVLASLRPRSFRGALYRPVFGNLTPLHLALDELRLAASPPRAVMDEAERVARRQAARAMRLHRELDRLADAFLDAGGRLIVWDGTPSPRVFPDGSLPAFGTLEAFVLAEDALRLAGALSDRGFAAGRREWAVESRDPVLAGRATTLVVRVDTSASLAASLAAGHDGASNARAALRSLRSRREADDARASARLVVHALPPEELAVALAARTGRARQDRLFRLVPLLELLTRLPGPLDGLRVAQLALAHGVGAEVAAGLRAVGAVLEEPRPDLEEAIARLPAVRPRLLEWGRYGPSSLRRFPWLRDAYYRAFCLLSLPSRRQQAGYALRSLPAVARGLGRAAVARARDGRPQPPLAYWVEPATLARLRTSALANATSSPENARSGTSSSA